MVSSSRWSKGRCAVSSAPVGQFAPMATRSSLSGWTDAPGRKTITVGRVSDKGRVLDPEGGDRRRPGYPEPVGVAWTGWYLVTLARLYYVPYLS